MLRFLIAAAMLLGLSPLAAARDARTAVAFHELVAAALDTLHPITDEFIDRLSRRALELRYAQQLATDRAYIVATATPGGTMSRDGAAKNVAKFHPELVLRLAGAIREARQDGLPNAGVYSGYRAPGWGVGGFRDKFKSWHGVGMAIDMTGIGRAGSAEARKWYAIAGRHRLFNPYGPAHRAEFNHYQLTMTKAVSGRSTVRATINARGPLDLARMWTAGRAFIRDLPFVAPVRAAARTKRHRYASASPR